MLGMKNQEANMSAGPHAGHAAHGHAGLGLDRRPFSFLMAASQNLRTRKPDDSPLALITDSNRSSFAEVQLHGVCTSPKLYSDPDLQKNWKDSNFSISKKLKDGTFGRSAGSVSRRMLESLFSKEQTRVKVENPLMNDNFIMSKPGGKKFEDPSEPIYTDPSLFELERSRSLRSIAFSTQGQRPKQNDEV